MAEWHLAPDYIVNNWTDELLNLMALKLTERKEREVQSVKVHSTQPNSPRKVSDKVLFGMAQNKIKVVKDGD